MQLCMAHFQTKSCEIYWWWSTLVIGGGGGVRSACCIVVEIRNVSLMASGFYSSILISMAVVALTTVKK